MKKIKEKILCAGHGGQGIMSMGRLLAYAAMNMNYEVTWIPSYGAEVRGGTAHSMIRIQTRGKICNPVVLQPTSCIVMNKQSLKKFIGRIAPRGLLLVDSSEIDSIPTHENIVIRKAPFTKIALQLGNKRVANMVAIGALNKIRKLFPLQELIKCLPQVFPRKANVININKKALEEGYSLVIDCKKMENSSARKDKTQICT